MAKAVLRSVNFGCSLIVLAMIGTTLSIFNATRALAPRSGMPAWAPNQRTWPQILLLSIACLSLAFSLFFFYAYWKGGHKRAQKATVYYTVFALGFFVFSTVMWIVGAAVLHSSKAHGNNQDMWGWSCNDNKRRAVYQDDVNYTLACRLQVRLQSARKCGSAVVTNYVARTGLSSVPLSKSSSRSSRLVSTVWCSTAFTLNASFTSRWISAIVPAPISTLLSYVPNPLPIPLALPRHLCRLPSHLTFNMTR